MTEVLPANYLNPDPPPQLYGKSGSQGTVLLAEVTNAPGTVLLDSNLAKNVQVRVTALTDSGEVDPAALNIYYQPSGANTRPTPVTIIGDPEPQSDGTYVINGTIPPLVNAIDGHLVVNYSDGATSDGVPVAQAPYPAVLTSLSNNNASRRIIMDYEELVDALAPPETRSNSGSMQSAMSRDGKNLLEEKDDLKRRDSIQGAAQHAVSRLRGLAEVISNSHLLDEFTKLETWANAQGITRILSGDMDSVKGASTSGVSLLEYATNVATSLSKLALILDQYTIGLNGSTASFNSSVLNQTAQAVRFTTNSVFDIDSPTTLFNTEYLIQQSSKGTFRQTNVDQLSCFDSWQRAEDNMVRQAKTIYNYATEKIYDGAKHRTGTFITDSNYCAKEYKVQTGFSEEKSSYLVRSQDSIDFFSAVGGFFVRVLDSIINKAKSFVVSASDSIFLQSKKSFAIEAEQDLHIVSKNGRVVIDASDIVFRSNGIPQFYVGPVTHNGLPINNPLFKVGTPMMSPIPVPRPDLLCVPHLNLLDSNLIKPPASDIDSLDVVEGTEIAVEGPPVGAGASKGHAGIGTSGGGIDSLDGVGGTPIQVEAPEAKVPLSRCPIYFVNAVIPTVARFEPVILPVDLLDYPKSPTAPVVPQPSNGVVYSPVFPAA